MECEKCRSKNLLVEKAEDGLRIDFCTYEESLETTIYFKCKDCSYKFVEVV